MNKKRMQKRARKQLEDMKAEFRGLKKEKEEKKNNRYGIGKYGK